MQQLINNLIKNLQTSLGHLATYRAGKKVTVPFREVYTDVVALAHFMRSLGVSKGSRIGIIGRNSYEWIVIDLACISLGAVTVPFDHENNYDYGSTSRHFNLKLLFVDRIKGPQEENVVDFSVVANLVRGQSPELEPVTYAMNDVLTVKFTSGSTASPKALEASVGSVVSTISNIQTIFKHSVNDVIMVFLPLFLAQQRYWVYSAILFDFTILVVPYTFALRSLAVDRPTVVMGVPGFYEAFQRSIQRTGGECANLLQALGGNIRYLWSGSAPLARSTLEFYENAQVDLFQGYGTNETCIVAKAYKGQNRLGSVGRVLPGKHVTFGDDDEILVRSDYPVNNQYLNCSLDESATVFRPDGFVATGDIGYLDSDGFLYITGRKKEIIVLSSGRKVHPSLIEKKIEGFSTIRSCMVYGDNRPSLVALVVTAGGGDRDAVMKQLANVNESLERDQKIYNALVLDEHELSERGLLSAQLKLRRHEALNLFSHELDSLY